MNGLSFRSLATTILCSLLLFVASWGLVSNVLAEDYNQTFLADADFSHRDLTDSSFRKATLRKADLSYANAIGVSFFGANLERANLEGADLRYADFSMARLSGANLSDANLTGVFAFRAKFNSAIVEGADFTDAEMREDTRLQLCEIAAGVNPTTGNATRDTLFCED